MQSYRLSDRLSKGAPSIIDRETSDATAHSIAPRIAFLRRSKLEIQAEAIRGLIVVLLHFAKKLTKLALTLVLHLLDGDIAREIMCFVRLVLQGVRHSNTFEGCTRFVLLQSIHKINLR